MLCLRHTFAAVTMLLLLGSAALAHDAWVETNTRMLHAGNLVHIDLKFGNHGNDHRDFKLTGKAPLDGATMHVHGPDERDHDFIRSLADLGYSPEEGYWSGRFIASEPGTYIVAYTVDRIVHYAPKRTIKSAKTMFVASRTLDEPGQRFEGHDRVLGHDLEIVPVHNPVLPSGPGVSVKLQVLFKGEPIAEGHRVSFIPRGFTLDEDFDITYERRTDEEGKVTYTPNHGNYYLAVVHKETEESGEDYQSTAYSATLTIQVPHACPCCAE